jgi:hypothetical protein
MRAHRQTHPNRWQQCHRAVHDRQIATTEVHARVKDECLRQAMVANEKSNPEVATCSPTSRIRSSPADGDSRPSGHPPPPAADRHHLPPSRIQCPPICPSRRTRKVDRIRPRQYRPPDHGLACVWVASVRLPRCRTATYGASGDRPPPRTGPDCTKTARAPKRSSLV